jgi:hypothetical protein
MNAKADSASRTPAKACAIVRSSSTGSPYPPAGHRRLGCVTRQAEPIRRTSSEARHPDADTPPTAAGAWPFIWEGTRTLTLCLQNRGRTESTLENFALSAGHLSAGGRRRPLISAQCCGTSLLY